MLRRIDMELELLDNDSFLDSRLFRTVKSDQPFFRFSHVTSELGR